MSRISFFALAAVAAACVPAARAQVTTIDFDDLTFSNYDAVAEGYKSRDTNTANVVVDFRTLTTGTNTVFDETVSLWNTGYSTLSKNAFQTANGTDFEMRLTADAGYTTTLEGFDFGAYNSSNSSSFLTITDSNNGVLYSEGLNTVTQPNVRNFTNAVTSSNGGTLTLRYGTDWNLGIDNIRFSQSVVGAAAPEPATLALFLPTLTLGGVILRRRR